MLARIRMQIPRFTRDEKLEKSSEETKNKTEAMVMFTGTLIDELISTVERAERHPHQTTESQEKRPYWYTATDREQAFDSKLLGVA